jgi:YidC/Oxa1 family membrane protein insertase
MTEQRNLILAIVLSVGIIFAFQFFYEAPRVPDAEQQEAQRQGQTETITPAPADRGTAGSPAVAPGEAGGLSPEEVLAASPRITIDNGRLHGSIPVIGGRIDDVRLADYNQTVEPGSPEIVLLSPAGTEKAYFVEHGWVPGGEIGPLPGADTRWEVVSGERLTAEQPVVLQWDNGQGLLFERRIELDENYMFTVTQTVTNHGAEPVTLYPYGLVTRWGTPETLGFYILHEGPVGVLGGTLEEIDYSDLEEDNLIEFTSQGGWLGITDKYWLTSLVPDQSEPIQANFRHSFAGQQNRYQTDYLGEPVTVQPGGTAETTNRVFAGAKEVDKLDAYSEQYNIPLFDRAVDFGWFYFLTKPIFLTLDFFYKYTGNYGVAILILTLLVKLLFFPLANKSYKAMSQMKLLQPKMVELREKYGDDRMRMNQELMALYKREKVNPMAGCLPIVVQIPVFFALYKVLFVSIEMRHAPFFGWIQDLSAPDPTSVFNLFGLIPWDPPSFLMIGIWPLLMGFTMWLQTRLNPQPADPIQAKVMLFLPVMFTFLFATFPAGLVIYWTWNNILSIAQQWTIMKRMGAPTS